MNNEEILKKATEKAIKKGWLLNWRFYCIKKDGMINGLFRVYFEEWIEGKYNNSMGMSLNDIIFSRDFAKAFFGEEGLPWDRPCGWKYNLQKMVLEEEPLKYLEKFLNK